MKPHEKHEKIAKPSFGNFGRNEFAFVGTVCGDINNLVQKITEKLYFRYKITYIDAEHKSDDKEETNTLKATEFTDKITYHRLDFQFSGEPSSNEFQKKFLLNEQDLILVNGNHFEAKQQIVFIDLRKEQSLHRKLPKLSQIKAFILSENVNDIFEFLKVGDWQSIPVFRANEIEKITQFIENQVVKVNLKGLILAGGQSTRMGTDKSLLDYHGEPQREFLFNLLQGFCFQTYLSCRVAPTNEIPFIEDKFLDLGPLGAILSAFRHDPNSAWIVLACDLPLLDEKTLKFLIENRNPSKLATAFYNPATGFPEPLLTIWEPKSYQVLLQFLGVGISCPRKVLINSDIEMVEIANPIVLMNANTQEEYDKAKSLI